MNLFGESPKVGDRVTVNGITFVLIKVIDDGRVVIQQYDNIEDHVFNENNSNVYEDSDLERYVKEEYPKQFPKEFLSHVEGDFHILSADAYDPDKTEYPFYKDRRNLTKYDKDGYAISYWTSTPYVGVGCLVRYVYPSGLIDISGAYGSNGVAPACVLNLKSGMDTDRCPGTTLDDIYEILKEIRDSL
ncbi:MAG: hypothetical protein IKF90_13710 [Parasporobacterium sp.]|nr:hypothetical protein [Parasporobacterium sp.]